MKKIKAARQPILDAESPRAARRRLDGLVAPPALPLPSKLQGEVFREHADALSGLHRSEMKERIDRRDIDAMEQDPVPDFDHAAERRSKPHSTNFILPARASLSLAFRRPVRV